ncbi:hypothetical protein KXV85_005644, partial [Aspergillus fumigatus]
FKQTQEFITARALGLEFGLDRDKTVFGRAFGQNRQHAFFVCVHVKPLRLAFRPCPYRTFFALALSRSVMIRKEDTQLLGGITKVVIRQTRIDAQPESVGRHQIRIRQITHHADIATLHIGLVQEVAAEQQARADVLLVEELNQFLTVDPGFGAD